MIKYILVCIGLISLLSGCKKTPGYRIEGEFSNLPDSVLYAVFENPDENVVDTLLSKKGKFKIEKRDGNYHTMTLFYNQKTKWITVYLEKGKKVKIAGDARYPQLISIKGGKINDKLTAFNHSVKDLLQDKADIIERIRQEDKIRPEEDETPVELANIQLQLSEAAIKYIQEHPEELVSAVLIQEYLMDPEDTRKLDEMLALLDSQIKPTPLVKELEQFSDKVKRTAIGAEAPDFVITDIYGKDLSLANFGKQYLLLSFAAPWCEMCKADNEYLKEIRKAFPEEKLGMVTVTLDANQAEVRKTIQSDSINWNLVSDSAGYASMLIDLYGVNAIPKNFLIDDTGKIVMNSESGKELQITLKELFEID